MGWIMRGEPLTFKLENTGVSGVARISEKGGGGNKKPY